MQTYFPYSALISLCNSIKQTIVRNPFFGEWYVNESEKATVAEPRYAEISELYY